MICLFRLRSLLVLPLLLLAVSAAAQGRFRDPEPVMPRVAYKASLAPEPVVPDPLLTLRRDELVRYFTRTLGLQPHQSQAVRRALATTLLWQAPEASAALQAVSPLEEVRLLLTTTQLAQLQRLEAAPLQAPELKWLAMRR